MMRKVIAGVGALVATGGICSLIYRPVEGFIVSRIDNQGIGTLLTLFALLVVSSPLFTVCWIYLKKRVDNFFNKFGL